MTTVLLTLLTVVVALLVVLVAGLLRSHAQILRVLHTLGVQPDRNAEASAATAPLGERRASHLTVEIDGSTPDGDPLTIPLVGASRSTLLVFLTSTCTTCAVFWTALTGARRLRTPGDAHLVVVTKGEEAESPARLRRLAPSQVPVVMSSAGWAAYAVSVAPSFAFVDGQSGVVVSKGVATSWDEVVSICEHAIAEAGRA